MTRIESGVELWRRFIDDAVVARLNGTRPSFELRKQAAVSLMSARVVVPPTRLARQLAHWVAENHLEIIDARLTEEVSDHVGDEDVFVVGRSLLCGLAVPAKPDDVATQTCLQLHWGDLAAASDGLVCMAAYGFQAFNSPTVRFHHQAVQYVRAMNLCFPQSFVAASLDLLDLISPCRNR